MCSFTKRRFGINTWNLAFVMFIILLFLFPMFSNANHIDLNENLLFMKSESSTEDTSKTKNPSFWKRAGFGIGYSGGLCWSNFLGKNRPLSLGRIAWHPLNSLSGNISYKTSSQWKVSLGIEYGYIDLKDRRSPRCYVPDSLWIQIFIEKTDWKVHVIPAIVSFKKQLSKKRYFTFGLEYYFVKGKSENWVKSWNYETDEYNTVILYTKHWERGQGVFFGLGWETELTSRIGLNIATVLNITRIREYRYELQEPFIWVEKTNFNFGGLFIKGTLTFKP